MPSLHYMKSLLHTKASNFSKNSQNNSFPSTKAPNEHENSLNELIVDENHIQWTSFIQEIDPPRTVHIPRAWYGHERDSFDL